MEMEYIKRLIMQSKFNTEKIVQFADYFVDILRHIIGLDM